MTKVDKIHLAIISIVNLALIFKMISIVWQGNDKAIILVLFGYPALIIINALIWLTLKIVKRPEYQFYKMATLVLLALFLPTLIISSLY